MRALTPCKKPVNIKASALLIIHNGLSEGITQDYSDIACHNHRMKKRKKNSHTAIIDQRGNYNSAARWKSRGEVLVCMWDIYAQ